MGRATEQAIETEAGKQNTAYNANAQTAFQGAQGSIDQQQGDINQYSAELSKFAAANPYGAGGAYQTAVNQSTANSAAGAGASASQAAQAAAVRGGLNSSAGVAAGAKSEEQNTRDLMATQAKANADRISKGAGYGQEVLSASQIPATLQNAVTGEQGRLAGEEAGAGNQALDIQQKAGEDPSFTDVLGENFAAALGETAGGGNGVGSAAIAKYCWVAAELYDGWDGPKTSAIREWIGGPCQAWMAGRLAANLYARFGERLATLIRHSVIARRLVKIAFDRALRRARRWEAMNGGR